MSEPPGAPTVSGLDGAALEIARDEYRFSLQNDRSWSAPNRAHDLRAHIGSNGLEVTSRTRAGDEKTGGWRLSLVFRSLTREGSPAWEASRPAPGPGGPAPDPAGLALLAPVSGQGRPHTPEPATGPATGIAGSPAPAVSAEPTAVRSVTPADPATGAASPETAALLPERDSDHIVIRRGTLTEWYANDERGLEQGFTIAARPEREEAGAGRGATPRPLILEMTIGGGLGASLSGDGQEVLFRAGAGFPVLRYGSLSVRDAAGNEIAARFALLPGRLQIRIDDEDAVYPLTIDPLMTSPAWTAESNQANAHFATSVATAGDVNGDGYSDVIIGAPLYDNGQTDEGRAFVFLGSASGLATSPAWTAESDQANAQFGTSVASAGDVNGDGFDDVIVGAPLYDNGQTDEGRAFVYLGSASGLATTAVWTAESNQANAHFGASVATAGDVNGNGRADIIVGAPLYDNGQTDEGRAFVYLGTATGPATSAAWTTESNQANAQFGASVASAGDTNGDGFDDVIVGAHLYDNGQTDEGRAYVYLGSASGLATTAVWTAESDQAGSDFGSAVAPAGDVNGDGFADVIVGAHLYSNGQNNEGRAFVYLGSGSGPATTAAWTAESDQMTADFGFSVATAGDVNGDGFADVVIGSPLYKNGQNGEGFAFLYMGSAAGLGATASWTFEADQASASVGTSVAAAGDVNGDGFGDVLVGANLFDNGQSDEGRAYAFLGSSSGPSDVSGLSVESNQDGALFAFSLATAGDVNGDGYSDVIIGAPTFDNGQTDEGRAFVYLGSPSGLVTTPAWTAESDQAGAQFGYSVASAGDVNGDGYSDVIVGAYLYDNGQTDEGRAFVYLGSPSGLAATPAWSVDSNQAGAQLGNSVASAGDVNGDGYSDVIVGAYSYDNGQTDEGRAFVYLGAPTGLATTPAWTAESNSAGALFGAPVASAGDVNGDGYSDVVVGAWLYGGTGRAYVFLGSISGLSASPAWVVDGDQVDALFGFPLACAGDVNGDGYSDIIVGATAYDSPEVDEGKAFVYMGSPFGLDTTPAWTADSNQVGAAFGYARASAGDVNGDGYSDVIIGAPHYDNGQADEGRVYLYLGSAAGLSTQPVWTFESNQQAALLANASGMAGDVNGDGYGDVLVGAHQYDNPEANEGRFYLFYGNAGTGLSRTPRQARADDSAPIDILGRSESETSFRLKALGRMAGGRGRVRMESEVKPLGTPLDGSATQRTSPLDTGTPGAAGSAASFSGIL